MQVIAEEILLILSVVSEGRGCTDMILLPDSWWRSAVNMMLFCLCFLWI